MQWWIGILVFQGLGEKMSRFTFRGRTSPLEVIPPIYTQYRHYMGHEWSAGRLEVANR